MYNTYGNAEGQGALEEEWSLRTSLPVTKTLP